MVNTDAETSAECTKKKYVVHSHNPYVQQSEKMLTIRTFEFGKGDFRLLISTYSCGTVVPMKTSLAQCPSKLYLHFFTNN